jgi:hypothetical protein
MQTENRATKISLEQFLAAIASWTLSAVACPDGIPSTVDALRTQLGRLNAERCQVRAVVEAARKRLAALDVEALATEGRLRAARTGQRL